MNTADHTERLPQVDALLLAQLVPMPAAIAAIEACFANPPLPAMLPRSALSTGGGDLLLMATTNHTYAGVKLAGIAPANPGRGLPLIQGVFVLLDSQTLEPRCLIDGAALTALRTAAVSALAAKHLARSDASALLVFGAGVQGRAHLDAMQIVRPLIRASVVDHSRARAERIVDRAREHGLDATVGSAADVARADLICTCTTSSAPVFDGRLVRPGTHITAIGAYKPAARELDSQIVARARIVVESREAVLDEAGDLVVPISMSEISEDDIAGELAEVVSGKVQGRTDDNEITLYKGVGLACEDLVVAAAAFERMQGLDGTGVPHAALD